MFRRGNDPDDTMQGIPMNLKIRKGGGKVLGKPKNKKLLLSSIIVFVGFTGMIILLINLLILQRTSM
jgi:hypothetical protein